MVNNVVVHTGSAGCNHNEYWFTNLPASLTPPSIPIITWFTFFLVPFESTHLVHKIKKPRRNFKVKSKDG